jgi:hypothetical protein
MRDCERCGAKVTEPFALFDYCALCDKNLCDDCMQEGCCDEVPALSGIEADWSAGEQDD